MLIGDPRICSELFGNTLVIRGVEEGTRHLLEAWLPPYFTVESVSGPADSASVRCAYDCDHLMREFQSARPSLGVDSRPAVFWAARSILAKTRLVFKVAAVLEGGINLHASCVARANRCVLLIGARGEGKTTAMLRLLSADAGWSLIANDQVVVRRTQNPSTIESLGYPALVSVRRRSGDLVDVPWEKAEYFGRDTLESAGRHDTSGLFAPSALADAFGANVSASALPVVAIRYRASFDPDVLEYSRLSISSAQFHEANLPLPAAYDRSALDAVLSDLGVAGRLLTQSPFGTLGEIEGFEVECGWRRLDAFISLLKRFIEGSEE